MALILTRLKGQVVEIGQDIEVEVVEIRGDKVRIGVKAPLDLPIVRREAKSKQPKNRGVA